jgi:hypothetical protein
LLYRKAEALFSRPGWNAFFNGEGYRRGRHRIPHTGMKQPKTAEPSWARQLKSGRDGGEFLSERLDRHPERPKADPGPATKERPKSLDSEDGR